MRAAAFRDRPDARCAGRTAGGLCSEAWRIDAAYGALDGHRGRGGLEAVPAAPARSAAGAAARRIAIDVGDGFASRRRAVRRYRRFHARDTTGS